MKKPLATPSSYAIVDSTKELLNCSYNSSTLLPHYEIDSEDNVSKVSTLPEPTILRNDDGKHCVFDESANEPSCLHPGNENVKTRVCASSWEECSMAGLLKSVPSPSSNVQHCSTQSDLCPELRDTLLTNTKCDEGVKEVKLPWQHDAKVDNNYELLTGLCHYNEPRDNREIFKCKQIISDADLQNKAHRTTCGIKDKIFAELSEHEFISRGTSLSPMRIPNDVQVLDYKDPVTFDDVISASSFQNEHVTSAGNARFLCAEQTASYIDCEKCKVYSSAPALRSHASFDSSYETPSSFDRKGQTLMEQSYLGLPLPFSSGDTPTKSSQPLLSILLQSNSSSACFDSAKSDVNDCSICRKLLPEKMVAAKAVDASAGSLNRVETSADVTGVEVIPHTNQPKAVQELGSEASETSTKAFIPKLKLNPGNSSNIRPLKKVPTKPKQSGDQTVLPGSVKVVPTANIKLGRPQSAQGRVEKLVNGSKVMDKKPKALASKPRPASASKANEVAKVSTSPKRVWEKSSIAWSSYGPNQLKTWSSVGTTGKEEKKCGVEKSPSSKQIRGGEKKRQSEVVTSYKGRKRAFLHPLAPIVVQNLILNDLPDEMLLSVFSYLSLTDLAAVSQTSNRFHQLAGDSALWQNIKSHEQTLTDNWFELMGQKCPKFVKLTGCCGKAVSNKGLRSFFKNCKSRLTYLHISKCTGDQLAGDVILLHASCHCRNLKHVIVPWSSTTDNGLSAISLALPVIKSLNINGNSSISDESFEILSKRHAPHMLALQMEGCFSVSSDSLVNFAENSKQLRELNIGLCSKISSECVVSLCEKLKALSCLDLHGLKTITDENLRAIVTTCRCLQVLVISQCTAISDSGISHIAACLPHLLRVELSGCSLVSDQGIITLCETRHELEHLDLSSTSATRRSVDCLARCCHQTIKTLKLSFCHNITQSSLMSLLSVCFGLKSLHLYGCKRISYAALAKINKNVIIEK